MCSLARSPSSFVFGGGCATLLQLVELRLARFSCPSALKATRQDPSSVESSRFLKQEAKHFTC
eukprot:3230075-Amphidinium_carterae.1